MKAPTLILMDVDQHAGLPSPRSLREFQRLFPGDAACAEYLERVRWGAASSVRIVASLVSRFESRPALTPSVRCSASLATQRRRPMPSFIPATGITLHLAGVCVNRIGVLQSKPRTTWGAITLAYLFVITHRPLAGAGVRLSRTGLLPKVERDRCSGLGSRCSSGPQAGDAGDMPCPARGPEHALPPALPSAGIVKFEEGRGGLRLGQSLRFPSPSRPGEFHPEPLTDPDVRLSPHPARATQRRLAPSGTRPSSILQFHVLEEFSPPTP